MKRMHDVCLGYKRTHAVIEGPTPSVPDGFALFCDTFDVFETSSMAEVAESPSIAELKIRKSGSAKDLFHEYQKHREACSKGQLEGDRPLSLLRPKGLNKNVLMGTMMLPNHARPLEA